MISGNTPDPTRCGSYRPGHEVHFIQARLAMQGPSQPGRAWAESDGLIEVQVEGAIQRFWTHDPDRIIALLEERGDQVQIRSACVLGIPMGDGRTTAFLSIGTEPTPCPTHQAPAEGTDVRDALEERGGFML